MCVQVSFTIQQRGTLKPSLTEKKLTIYLNSEQKIVLGSPALVRAAKNKNYFIIQCYRTQFARYLLM